MIKIATVFSGIGAPEEALRQLNKDYQIVFACDNGERELKVSYEEIIEATKEMTYDERLLYVNALYEKTKKHNYVKDYAQRRAYNTRHPSLSCGTAQIESLYAKM